MPSWSVGLALPITKVLEQEVKPILRTRRSLNWLKIFTFTHTLGHGNILALPLATQRGRAVKQ